jgi:hypothetical protein
LLDRRRNVPLLGKALQLVIADLTKKIMPRDQITATAIS